MTTSLKRFFLPIKFVKLFITVRTIPHSIRLSKIVKDNISAGTPNGGKGYSALRSFFILKNLFNTKNLAISIIWYIFAQKQNVWQ